MPLAPTGLSKHNRRTESAVAKQKSVGSWCGRIDLNCGGIIASHKGGVALGPKIAHSSHLGMDRDIGWKKENKEDKKKRTRENRWRKCRLLACIHNIKNKKKAPQQMTRNPDSGGQGTQAETKQVRGRGKKKKKKKKKMTVFPLAP